MGIVVGVAATVTMDVLAIVSGRLGLAMGAKGEWVGRWYLGMAEGRFVHTDITVAPEQPGERRAALVGHYIIGIILALFYVFGATVQHQYYALAVIAMINAGIAAFYYLNVVRAMFFTEAEQDAEGKAIPLSTAPVAPAAQVIVLLCVVVTLWLGIYPLSLINWANDASQYLLTIVR